MLRREEAGWANPKILGLFALVFFLGTAVGATVVRIYLHTVVKPEVHVIAKAEASSVEVLSKELNLTSEQRAVVMQVLDDYAKYYQNLEADRENVSDHGKRRIMSVLTPEQQKRFLEIFTSPALPGGSK